jgi:hypothetical protein
MLAGYGLGLSWRVSGAAQNMLHFRGSLDGIGSIEAGECESDHMRSRGAVVVAW